MANIKVRIPSPLLRLTQNKEEVEVEGTNVKDLFVNMEKSFPGIANRIYDDKNNLRKFINIYVNDEDIRFLDGENSALKNGDVVSIIPAIAGGSF